MTGQDNFATALLDPAQPVPDGLRDPQGRPAGKRFDVYRNNVAVSLTEALETGFPIIRKLLGDAFFKAMAGVHLRQHPPRSPVMQEYGQDMPAFLETFPPVAHLPYLPDVARLELALRRAYHASDASALDPAAIAALPDNRLMAARFGLSPAAHILRSAYPVHGIWQANTQPDAPKPAWHKETVLISRPGFDPMVDLLTPAQDVFLTCLLERAPLAAALDRANRLDPEFDLSSFLALLFARGVLVSVNESPAP